MATAYSSWLTVAPGVTARVIVNLSWSSGTLSWSGQVETSGGWASGNDPWTVTGAFSGSGTKSWKTSTNGKTTIASGSRSVAQKTTSQTFSVTFTLSNIVNTTTSRSATVSVTVPAAASSAPTDTPDIVTSMESDTKVLVGWSHDHDWIRIQRWTPSDEWTTVAVVRTNPNGYIDPVSTNRHYRYRGQYGTGSSPGTAAWGPFSSSYSQAWEDTRPVAPLAPDVSKTTAGDIVVRLMSPTNLAIPPVAGWLVEHSTDGGSTWSVVKTGLSMTGLSWTYSSPDPAVSHTFRTRYTTQYGDAPNSYASPASKTISTAVPPLAPTPATLYTADATEPVVMAWRHRPGTDDAGQTRYDLRYRAWGSTSWTTVTGGTTASHTLPAGTFTNGPGQGIEWQVRTYGVAATASPWSELSLTYLSARPIVTIISPDGTGPHESPELAVSWTYHDAESTSQTGYRATLLQDGQAIEVRSASTAATSVRFRAQVADGASYTVRVEVRDGDVMWSLPAEVAVSVVYRQPPVPALSADWSLDGGYTVLSVDAPAPSGAELPVDHVRVERATGDAWVVVGDGLSPGQAITDMIPPLGQAVIYRAVAVSDIGSVAYSAHVPVETTAQWVFINHGPDFGSVVRLQTNVVAGRRLARERSRHHFAGRRDPVELAGPAVSRSWTVSADLMHECIVGERDEQASWEQVADLGAAAAPVCLRGPHGLRVFASVDDVSETGLYGDVSTVTVALTGIDWSEVAVEPLGVLGEPGGGQ